MILRLAFSLDPDPDPDPAFARAALVRGRAVPDRRLCVAR